MLRTVTHFYTFVIYIRKMQADNFSSNFHYISHIIFVHERSMLCSYINISIIIMKITKIVFIFLGVAVPARIMKQPLAVMPRKNLEMPKPFHQTHSSLDLPQT